MARIPYNQFRRSPRSYMAAMAHSITSLPPPGGQICRASLPKLFHAGFRTSESTARRDAPGWTSETSLRCSVEQPESKPAIRSASWASSGARALRSCSGCARKPGTRPPGTTERRGEPRRAPATGRGSPSPSSLAAGLRAPRTPGGGPPGGERPRTRFPSRSRIAEE